MTDCIADETGKHCINCGWVWKLDKPWPRRNCAEVSSRGLGDTVAKITKAIGIKPCGGCKERQKKLNEMFPYADSGSLPSEAETSDDTRLASH